MNAKWTARIVAGVALLVLSSQVMAQPWGGGGRGRGMGRMGQGPGPMWQQGGGGGPQGGAGAWCPLGVGPRGGGAWNAPGPGQLGFGRGLARRLGLTDDQIEKIQDIVAEARTRTINAIKEVLTEEQVKQLDQIRGNVGPVGPRGRGPAYQNAPGRPAGPGFRQGRGWGSQMGPRGRGPAGQPFANGPGAGWGMGPRRGMNRPDVQAQQPPTDRADGQDANVVPPPVRRMPPLEQMFDQADTNHDGALTRDEIHAFHESMGPGRGWRNQ